MRPKVAADNGSGQGKSFQGNFNRSSRAIGRLVSPGTCFPQLSLDVEEFSRSVSYPGRECHARLFLIEVGLFTGTAQIQRQRVIRIAFHRWCFTVSTAMTHRKKS